MLSGLFGQNKKKPDFVFDKFKAQIEKHGMRISSVDETELIHISHGDLTLKVSLDNLRRNYARDNDVGHISDFVETLLSYTIEIPTRWEDAKNDIYLSFFPGDFDFKNFIHRKVTDDFCKIYIHNGHSKYTWIREPHLEEWKISEEELSMQADRNANRILKNAQITFEQIEGRKLGMIESEEISLKGALLFASSIKEKVQKDFGFPFYAVLPVRDFCYIFSEEDFEFFADRIGGVVVDEYTKSGHPITTEILKFNDTGVEAIGKYPVE